MVPVLTLNSSVVTQTSAPSFLFRGFNPESGGGIDSRAASQVCRVIHTLLACCTVSRSASILPAAVTFTTSGLAWTDLEKSAYCDSDIVERDGLFGRSRGSCLVVCATQSRNKKNKRKRSI